jgi:hypothetical protein
MVYTEGSGSSCDETADALNGVIKEFTGPDGVDETIECTELSRFDKKVALEECH